MMGPIMNCHSIIGSKYIYVVLHKHPSVSCQGEPSALWPPRPPHPKNLFIPKPAFELRREDGFWIF